MVHHRVRADSFDQTGEWPVTEPEPFERARPMRSGLLVSPTDEDLEAMARHAAWLDHLAGLARHRPGLDCGGPRGGLTSPLPCHQRAGRLNREAAGPSSIPGQGPRPGPGARLMGRRGEDRDGKKSRRRQKKVMSHSPARPAPPGAAK